MHRANKKYRAISHAGKELFWKYGISRVSVEEVCKNAGVSKMTYYKFFKNKNELVKSILGEVVDISMKEYRKTWDSSLPFEMKIQKTIEFKMKYSQDISQELITDLYSSADQDLQIYFQGLIQSNLQMIRSDFMNAQKSGELSPDISIEFILYIINKIPEIMLDKQLTQNYREPQQLIREFLEFFFYGIIPRQKRDIK